MRKPKHLLSAALLGLIGVSLHSSIAGEIVDPTDPDNHRHTEEEYAKKHAMNLSALDRRIAATGALYCGTWFGSTSLIRKTGDESTQNIISTAAHIFYDPTDCAPRAKPNACYFIPKSGTNTYMSKAVKVSRLVGMGYKCPQIPRRMDDWAILKLERRAEGITPYDIDDLPVLFNVGQPVVAVAAYSFDFYKLDSAGRRIYPKHIGDCHIKHIDSKYVISNCDRGNWASGGAILSDDLEKPPKLLAMISTNDEPIEMAKKAASSGQVNRLPFDLNGWRSFENPINEDFIEALNEASGQPNSSRAANGPSQPSAVPAIFTKVQGVITEQFKKQCLAVSSVATSEDGVATNYDVVCERGVHSYRLTDRSGQWQIQSQ